MVQAVMWAIAHVFIARYQRENCQTRQSPCVLRKPKKPLTHLKYMETHQTQRSYRMQISTYATPSALWATNADKSASAFTASIARFICLMI